MMADNEIESQERKKNHPSPKKPYLFRTAQHNLFLMIDGEIILFD